MICRKIGVIFQDIPDGYCFAKKCSYPQALGLAVVKRREEETGGEGRSHLNDKGS